MKRQGANFECRAKKGVMIFPSRDDGPFHAAARGEARQHMPNQGLAAQPNQGFRKPFLEASSETRGRNDGKSVRHTRAWLSEP